MTKIYTRRKTKVPEYLTDKIRHRFINKGICMHKKFFLLAVLSLSAPVALAQDYTPYGMDVIEMSKEGRVSKNPGHVGGSYSFDEDKHRYKFEDNNKQTKRRFVQEMKLDHVDKKLARVTNKSVEFENGKEEEDFITYSLVTDGDEKELGKATSITSCRKASSLLLLGKDFKCVTLNKKLCDHVSSEAVKSLLEVKLNECNKVMEDIKLHQKSLAEMTGKDYEQNISKISGMSGRLSKQESVYNTEVVDLASLSKITEATKEAQDACAQMSQLLVEVKAPEPADATTDAEQAPKKNSWWKKTKNAVKKVNPL